MNEDKATRYHRLKRIASILSLVWTVLFLAGLMGSGLSERVRDVAERSSGAVGGGVAGWCVGLFVYVLTLSLLSEIVALPIAFFSGFIVERRYGLSRESPLAWAVDQAKAFAVGLVLGWGGAAIVYGLIRSAPDSWWWIAALTFSVLIVGLANLAPVLLLPLFYSVRPLERDILRQRLLALAERAGAHVLGVYEWGLGAKTTKANAALAGIGGTRRILVSDTMLAEYSDDEIEVVLAHELAHHVHGDIWKGIAFESGLMVAGFFCASRILGALVGPLGLRGTGDIAGLPLLLLATGAVSFVMVPVAHAMSRAFERSADRFALRLTRNSPAFISAMRRLGAQNLAEENPSPIVQWLFYSHPPLRERIASAEAFRE